ncbi:hypothetical protein OSB04_002440 [Centaurea solstitialis]|uniref:Tropomyosin n=1 Tax=Centaurea solstitialis TaxID=347529 RepID=A0AA38TTE3_9ASTR|nr:hypothetical protein OSB04_002440 [Centaurea solstitialis]
MTMAISPSLLPALFLSYLLIICNSMATISQSSTDLIHEIREAELKVVRLEFILEESIIIVDSKNLYIKEREKLVEEMTDEVDHLQSAVLTMKNDSSSANERFHRLEEEVRLLWAAARRNNFELHTLESKAQDAESRLEITKSRVEKMASVVTEQWIQIQHLEQALEIAERSSKAIKRQLSSTRCSFLKVLTHSFAFVVFIQSQLGDLGDWWEVLERTWSVVKQNHHQVSPPIHFFALLTKKENLHKYSCYGLIGHYQWNCGDKILTTASIAIQLQRFVMNNMQKWKYTAAYANKEVVFFVVRSLFLVAIPLFLENLLA